MTDKNKKMVKRGLADLWGNLVLSLKVTFYVVAIIFFAIGVAALFLGGIGIGIFLMAFNAFLLVLFRRLDKKVNSNFDQEFDEMVRRNRGE